MCKLLQSVALAAALWGAAVAAPIDGFPPDPAGAVVKDRLSEVVTLGKQDYRLYAAVLAPSKGKPGLVNIYSGTEVPAGMEWKKLYTWTLAEGGMNLDVSHAVLRVAAHEPDEIQFFFESWFKYVEGRAVMVLHYYPKTGKFEFQLAD